MSLTGTKGLFGVLN